MASNVEVRGLSCPHPVILARTAIDSGDPASKALVKTVTSRQNFRRAAEKLGCTVQAEEAEDEFKPTLTR